MTASALYVGTLGHARRAPVRHAFAYRVHMLYLDLAELDALPGAPLLGVERARPMSFRRRDYLGPAHVPLDQAVRDEVERQLGTRPLGPIRLLTMVRSLGYVFNPVSFYYCFDPGEQVVAIAAEITNTPWRERHTYVVPAGGADFAKRFHVSPFFGMAQGYRWRFSPPGERLTVDMENLEGADKVFHARLALRRRPLSWRSLAAVTLRQPVMAAAAHAAIYWQALRLRGKGAPYHAHP
jgi:DUF1365 family protein